jgi:hypothetical protein
MRLKAKRAEIMAKLDALRDGTNGRLIAPPGPTIAPPPLPPRNSTPPPGIPNKRPRTSTHGPDPEPTTSNAHASSSSTNDMEVDDDGSVRPHPHHPLSCLMVARCHIQGDSMMQKPRFTHRYTRGPDGMHGFSQKRVLKGPMDVVTSRPIFLADTVSRDVHSRRLNVLFFSCCIHNLCLSPASCRRGLRPVLDLRTELQRPNGQRQTSSHQHCHQRPQSACLRPL